MAAPIQEQIDDYLAAPIQGRKGRRRTPKHLQNIRRALERVVAVLDWRTLRDVDARSLRSWVAEQGDAGVAPRTIQAHLAAWKTFLRWLRQDGRYVGEDPFVAVSAPRHEDRRKPRALNEDEGEIEGLLIAALRRPVQEASVIRRGPRKGQLAANIGDSTRAKLERHGRERWLAYRVLLLTGLRAGELAAVTVGDLELEADPPTVHLDKMWTKNGEPAAIPLRTDLATDLAAWITEELEAERERARERGEAVPARLAPERRLLHVPALREMDKDLKFAEIPKRVRGRTACRHSLRHTTATLLGKLGAPPQVISTWMRHAGDTLAERAYTDRSALDVLPWLDRLPAWRGDGEPQPKECDGERSAATGTGGDASSRVLTRESPKNPGTPWPFVSPADQELDRTDRRNSARDHDLAPPELVGERGLEPPTRSTQSYASTN